MVPIWSDPVSMDYHLKQWSEPKYSTTYFHSFIEDELKNSSKVIDLGCGTGASTYYLAERNIGCDFLGIDNDTKLVEIGNKILADKNNVKNVKFAPGDCFDLTKFSTSKFVGAISLQTLSWLESWRKPMEQIFLNINPNWIALSSLFYPGDISAEIIINEPARDRKTNYNIISIKELDRYAIEYNYKIIKFKKFEIPVDIAKPLNEDIMGTYTLKVCETNNSYNMQVSGPILMPWYFVYLERIN